MKKLVFLTLMSASTLIHAQDLVIKNASASRVDDKIVINVTQITRSKSAYIPPKIEASNNLNNFLRKQDLNLHYQSASVIPESMAPLDSLIRKLETRNRINIRVYGFADSSGNSQKNLILSKKRAQYVADFLKKRVPKNTYFVTGLGATQPIASNRTLAGRTRNRRVEIVQIGKN